MTTRIAELANVTFAYRRGQTVVREFSARFESGQVSAVTGPSGCGKSTILSLAGLLLQPDAGTVTVNGVDCSRATDRQRSSLRRREVGFVFQDSLLETSMTVWQNLSEALPPDIPTVEARSAAEEALHRLALPSDMMTRRALTLSGGQAQRVAVVRALLKRPSLVLADEPTGNLDDATGRMVLDSLLDYGRQTGRAMVIVTHDERIVDEVDEVIRLSATP